MCAHTHTHTHRASMMAQMVKNLRAIQEAQVPSLGQGRSPAGRKWQPTAVFLLGEFHGQRSLVAYSPRGHKESGTTETTTHTQIL